MPQKPKNPINPVTTPVAVKTPSEKARYTATWAKTMTKVVVSMNNSKPPFWHVINFLGANKSESRGIVDLLAVRKSHVEPGSPLKRGDLFEFVLIQSKGGSARWPTAEDRERLREVQAHYNAKAVLLSEWKPGSMPKFYQLSGDSWGEPIDPHSIFGNGKKSPVKKSPASKPKAKKPIALKRAAAAKAWITRKASK